VQIAIRDQGPGISVADRARIFQPFFTTKTKGTGLGLAIAARIVESHGGRIELGKADCGAELIISLPQTQTHSINVP
jgi:signal transduction histidine kinase